jgi:hypothetical protein
MLGKDQEAVERLHAEWTGVHDRLRTYERLLSEAIALYARGGPKPEGMIAEVEQMRMDCAERFKALMDAVKALG